MVKLKPEVKKLVKWEDIIDELQQVVKLNASEKARISENVLAKMIYTTAYLSECHNPARTAIANLSIFIADTRCKRYFAHNDETLRERLLLIQFPEGNQAYTEACMLLLELASLNDHKADFRDDLINGKSNPLINQLNYDLEKDRIMKEYNQLPLDVLTHFSAFSKHIIKNDWWW